MLLIWHITGSVNRCRPSIKALNRLIHPFLPCPADGIATLLACFNANAICSSLCLVFFIVSSFLVGRHKAGELSLEMDEKTGRTSWPIVKNSVSLRSSSRMRPLKLSTNPFCVGLPGAI